MMLIDLSILPLNIIHPLIVNQWNKHYLLKTLGPCLLIKSQNLHK